MKLNSKTTAGIVGVLIFFIVILTATNVSSPDKYLHVNFLNVGQGDSTLVIFPNKFIMLIDGGPDNKVLSELEKSMPYFENKINVVVLSHPHADHLDGLIEVIKRYNIDEIWSTDTIHSTPDYLAWLNTIKDKKIPLKLIQAGFKKSENEINIEALWPKKSYKNVKIDNFNNTSLVLKITYDGFSVILPGDIEETVESSLAVYGQQLKTDVLKIPHHGSANAANVDFINLVHPETAIFSVGENNKFGHPAISTLNKYENIGSNIFRTDKNGKIEVISDGNKYWIKTEK